MHADIVIMKLMCTAMTCRLGLHPKENYLNFNINMPKAKADRPVIFDSLQA